MQSTRRRFRKNQREDSAKEEEPVLGYRMGMLHGKTHDDVSNGQFRRGRDIIY